MVSIYGTLCSLSWPDKLMLLVRSNILGATGKGSSIFFAIFPYVQSVRKGEGGGKIGDRAYVRGYLKKWRFLFLTIFE